MNTNLINNEVNWKELLLAILSLLPVLVGFMLFHEPMLFNVGLVTISLFIPCARIKSGIFIVVLQFVLIWFCFSVLFFALNKPYLFVLFCALLAFSTIYVTRYGSNLRTIANFIFIPAVYLACELRESLHGAALIPSYIKFISLLPIALLSVILLLLAKNILTVNKKSKNLSMKSDIQTFTSKVFHPKIRGEEKLNWLKEGLAIFFGVMLAATFVAYMHIAHGEWVIWSTAAVITGDMLSAKKKTQDRLIGLIFGIPLGFFLAQFLPKTTVVYSLAALGVMLTLIAFKKYRVAFGGRCFFIAVASYVATSTPQIALERVENVILGGIIGMASLYICHQLMGRFGRR